MKHYQPQIIEVEPHRIMFSKVNPRKHSGEEYAQLKASIQEVGILIPPTVRSLPGSMYEVIDGEGRVQAAQELNIPKIDVANLGMISDEEAEDRLVISNVVRDFNIFAECVALANLHRRYLSNPHIAHLVGMQKSQVDIRIAIGYIPNLFNTVSGVPDGVTIALSSLTTMLTLRIKTGKAWDTIQDEKGNIKGSLGVPHDEVYDYREVLIGLEKIKKGELKTEQEVKEYVSDRRREMFEERFNKELDARLMSEKQRIEEALEQSHEHELSQVQEETRKEYEAQLEALNSQLSELNQSYDAAMRAIAKKPDDTSVLKKREEELSIAREQAEKTRLQYIETKNKVEREITQAKERAIQEAIANIEKQREKMLDALRSEQEQVLSELEAQLQASYSQKEKELLKKEIVTFDQMVLDTVNRMSEIQRWLRIISSQEMNTSFIEVPQHDQILLIAQIRGVRKDLDTAEYALMQLMTHPEKAIEGGRNGVSVEA